MTVISACVMGRQKPLLARQFVEISRVRIEGLLNAFLKLVEHAGTDHTYLESECVRYVYQPLESVYLVLLTTKQSNILEDLHTLRVFSTIVQDACAGEGLSGGVDVEQVVMDNVFTILFMLDELVSFGLREAVSLSQIRTYKDMDSNEEKLQKLLTESKEKEEKERRRQIAIRLDKERAVLNKKKKPAVGPGDTTARGSYAADSMLLLGKSSNNSSFLSPADLGDRAAAAADNYLQQVYEDGGGVVSLSLNNGSSSSEAAGDGAPPGGRGMQLGPQPLQQQRRQQQQLQQEQQQASLAAALLLPGGGAARGSMPAAATDGEIAFSAGHASSTAADDAVRVLAAAAGAAGSAEAAAANISAVVSRPLMEPVQALLEEKVKGSLHAEGGVDELDIQGTFFVTVYEPVDAGLAAFKVTPEDKRFKMKVHPNLNKGSYAQHGLLELRDSSRAYAVNTPVAILKWRLQTKDETLCPLAISCWSASTPDGVALTVEVEAAEEVGKNAEAALLRDVRFSFTCPSSIPHKILRVEGGSVEDDGCSLVWQLPQMCSSSNNSSSGEEILSSATLEFFAGTDVHTVLPFSVEFTSSQSLCDLDVYECFHMLKKESIAYSLTRRTDYSLTVHA